MWFIVDSFDWVTSPHGPKLRRYVAVDRRDTSVYYPRPARETLLRLSSLDELQKAIEWASSEGNELVLGVSEYTYRGEPLYSLKIPERYSDE
jgi:hypothetical protein